MADSTNPELLRPRPLRPFVVTPTLSSEATTPTSDTDTAATPPSSSIRPETPSPSDPTDRSAGATMPNPSPPRTRSILNLTASTLLGIYSPTIYDSSAVHPSEPSTPWGTGALSPARGPSLDGSRPSAYTLSAAHEKTSQRPRNGSITRPKQHGGRRGSAHHHTLSKTFRTAVLPVLTRTAALFAAGIMYGVVISRLHDNRNIAPVQVEGIDGASWWYGGFWGMAGVGLGWGLPLLDRLYDGDELEEGEEEGEEGGKASMVGSREARAGMGARRGEGWEQVVRSVGAFVGIAFAIRRLPWQSTLQVSLTLALVNPVIWHLLDRTKPGFLLSTLVGLLGAATILLVNPDIVPSPAALRIVSDNGTARVERSGGWASGIVSNEMVGVATWIASVLFCSCVCFGNIGRRLAPRRGG